MSGHGGTAGDPARPAPIDPDLLPIVEQLREAARSRAPMEAVALDQLRARAVAQFAPYNRDKLELPRVEDLDIALTGGGRMAARLYVPNPAPTGVIVHFHGGGWTIGDLELEDGALRYLAYRSECRILSLDYPLAPEHPFPAPIEAGCDALAWLARSGSDYDVLPNRFVLSGASAGANCALGTALALRDEGWRAPVGLLLMQGAFLRHADTASRVVYGQGDFVLSNAAMHWFWANYLGDRVHRWAAMEYADLSGLPRCLVQYAQCDPLADDSVILARRLEEAGGEVALSCAAGAVHGFTQYVPVSALARAALDEAAEFARSLLVPAG